MEQNNIPEEVTITPVIRDLENLFTKVFTFILKIFKSLLQSLALFVGFCFKNALRLTLIAFIGALIGFFSIYLIPRKYATSMVLETNINAKSQLHNDIAYFDALIEREQHGKLASTFNISEEEAASLKDINISAFTSEYEKYKILDIFYKGLDSTTKRLISASPTLLEEINGLSSKYVIQIIGTNEGVFQKIENQLIAFLERPVNFVKEREETKKILNFQRLMILKQINDLDTLKRVANKRLLLASTQATNPLQSLQNYSGVAPENTFNPLKIYDKYASLYEELKTLDIKLSKLENTYTIHSHFSEFGSKYGYGKLKRAVFLGLIFLGFALLSFASKAIITMSHK